MFNPFKQFNIAPKNHDSENNLGPSAKNKLAEPTANQTKNDSRLEPQMSPKAETLSASMEKPAPVKASGSIRDSALFKVVGNQGEEIERELLENSRRIFETQPINEWILKKNFFSSKAFKELERPATPEEAEMD